MELLGVEELLKVIDNPETTSEDIKLLRYYTTENELVILVKYKTVDFRCNIDKLAFIDNEISGSNSVDMFVKNYLSGPNAIKILGEDENKEEVNLVISTQ